MWNNLSMADRADIIALGVKNSIYNLNSIRECYNSFAKGGYIEWKEKMKEHKGIDIDHDPTYDYAGFYNSNPDKAWDMLNKSSNAHFTDEFKTALHPTFSNESRYSGYKNKYNPNGIVGGTWIDNHNYRLSQSQFDYDWDIDRTLNYLQREESEPVRMYAPDGSTILRSITVTPQLSALNASRQAKSPNADFSHAQDMTGIQRFGANYLAGVPIIGTDPHTCLNTVTGFYNPNNTVAANPNMVAHPEDYGYTEIHQTEVIPGDLIILSDRNNHPTHAVMFDSTADEHGIHNGFPFAPGDTLVNYSNGGRGKGDYRLQGPLPRFDNPEQAGGDFSGRHRYYRYIGKRKKK